MTEKEEKEALTQEISKLSSVVDMTTHEGWRIVVEHFRRVLTAIKDQLVSEPDPTKIIRLQERHRAFQEMLHSVDSMSELCSNYRQALTELNNEITTKEQYGI